MASLATSASSVAKSGVAHDVAEVERYCHICRTSHRAERVDWRRAEAVRGRVSCEPRIRKRAGDRRGGAVQRHGVVRHDRARIGIQHDPFRRQSTAGAGRRFHDLGFAGQRERRLRIRVARKVRTKGSVPAPVDGSLVDEEGADGVHDGIDLRRRRQRRAAVAHVARERREQRGDIRPRHAARRQSERVSPYGPEQLRHVDAPRRPFPRGRSRPSRAQTPRLPVRATRPAWRSGPASGRHPGAAPARRRRCSPRSRSRLHRRRARSRSHGRRRARPRRRGRARRTRA